MIIEVDLQQHQDFTLKAVANSNDKCFFFFSDPFKIARVYNMSNIHRNGPFFKIYLFKIRYARATYSFCIMVLIIFSHP